MATFFLASSLATMLFLEKVLSNHIYSESVRLEGHYGDKFETGSDIFSLVTIEKVPSNYIYFDSERSKE